MTSTFSQRFLGNFAIGLVIAACGSPALMAAEKQELGAKPEKPAAAAKTGDKTPAKVDPFAVPDGTAEELIKYLHGVGAMEPSAQDREHIVEFSMKAGKAMLTATDKILAAKPNESQASEAVQWKIVVLRMLDRLGDPQAKPAISQLPAKLDKLGWPKLARSVRGALLGSELPKTAGNAKAFQDLLPRIVAHVSQGELGQAEIQLILQTAFASEDVSTAVAVQTYADLAKLLSASKDKKAVEVAARFQGAARRLTLVGKPLEVSGVALDGKPLDWASYRGKVVLVTFWATWCAPCRQEIKTIRQDYAAYHDKGFEVVAISIDRERGELEDFLKEQSVPWTVLFDQSLNSKGADKSMATAYGVLRIPELIVVGKDGKVVSINARGPQLKKLLTNLLGIAEEPAKKKS